MSDYLKRWCEGGIPVGRIPAGEAHGMRVGRIPEGRRGKAAVGAAAGLARAAAAGARGSAPEYREGAPEWSEYRDGALEWSWCGGPPLSYFQDEYLTGAELFPVREVRFHGIRAPVPRDGWPALRRAYGQSVGYKARIDEHGGVWADLREPEHARLRRPASVRRLGWWLEWWR
jgi:hypothetical protein